MIDAGIELLVMSDSGVLAVCAKGGYLLSLPNDAPLPNWSYQVAGQKANYALDGTHGFVARRLQIDCYGPPTAPGLCITLAKAIDNVLSAYKGTLPDTDHTYVFGCFASDVMDFFDAAGRTYRRMLEYEIQFFG